MFFLPKNTNEGGISMKGKETKNNSYATNEAGVIKAMKKPEQPKADSIKGNDLRSRGGKK